MFTSTRRFKFLEMEYALPREAAVPALREVQRMIENARLRISLPIEVRTAPADDLWLSTAHGRDTAYLAFHMQDPQVFYNREDSWASATEKVGSNSQPVDVDPYYVVMRLPNEQKEEFLLMQPFTPLNQTLRGLLNGGPIGHDALISIAWCLGILVVGYWWARTVFQRGRVR